MTAPPPRPPDRHYDFRWLNIVFAWTALIFLAVTLWMVFQDYAKPWKRFQSEFRNQERVMLEAEAEEERNRLDQEAIAQIQADIAAQEAALTEQRTNLDEQADLVDKLGKKVYAADAEARATKSLLDTARFQYESAIQHEADVEGTRGEVERLQEKWFEERIALETLQEEMESVEAAIAEKEAGLVAAEDRLVALNEGLENLETRVANLDKSFKYLALNIPLLDFFQPTLTVEQVILPDLYQDIHFTENVRVDRCMTCHVAANRRGFDGEEWAQPFRSHPRLDLFLSASSPHPYTRFGCTACHGGLDRATDFSRAGHTPLTAEQKAEWKAQYGWKKQKYLETPIVPAGYTETGCLTCHADGVWTGETSQQDVGRELMLKMGCFACHLIDYPAYQDLPRPGPDLTRVASKTNQAWAQKWVEAPRDFHPTTWMPHFFYQENTTTPENLARQKAEVVASVAYIWDKSDEVEYPPAPSGDAARGEALFNSIGCTGCHIMDAGATRDDLFPQINRMHGPNLIRTGSKVEAGWLYAWLENPKQYNPLSRMPHLRLEGTEAADLTAYLMASRDPAFENLELMTADPAARDGLVLAYLQNTHTIENSEAKLAAMSEHERNVYLGGETIRKYGCFGCHEVEGFEDAKPIGVELTEEGSKPIHQFDFGHVHDVPHTRHDWIFTKMRRPRIWDEGKEEVKSYGELYKMPNFGMSEREARAVMVNVLGFQKEGVRAQRKAGYGRDTEAMAAGRKLVSNYNCQGCHLVEGLGHAIKTSIEDVGMLPPNIASQGARVQGEWLFGYLHDPGAVRLRPWLTVRMPSFQFSDEQINQIVAYFAEMDGRDHFSSPPERAAERELVVGETLFNMLQCAKCHPAGADAAAAMGQASASELAPALDLAADRLRHDWVPHWIKDPQSWIPGTKMPSNFAKSADGTYQSPLVNAINSPRYTSEKARVMRHFESEEELAEYLGDVDQVTEALRDHIWWNVAN